jgi:hypothetical protein
MPNWSPLQTHPVLFRFYRVQKAMLAVILRSGQLASQLDMTASTDAQEATAALASGHFDSAWSFRLHAIAPPALLLLCNLQIGSLQSSQEFCLSVLF